MSDLRIAAAVVITAVFLGVILFRWQRARKGSDAAAAKRETQRLLYGSIAAAAVVIGLVILSGGR